MFFSVYFYYYFLHRPASEINLHLNLFLNISLDYCAMKTYEKKTTAKPIE